MDPILKYIEDVFENSERNYIGTLGEKFVELLDTYKTIKSPLISTELDKKIKYLTQCEEKDDLAWFDFSSWNLLPNLFKIEFDNTIDPLHWSGAAFFSYSNFLSHNELMNLLTDTSILYVLKDTKSRHIVHIVDLVMWKWMAENKFRNFQLDFNKRILCVMTKKIFREIGGSIGREERAEANISAY